MTRKNSNSTRRCEKVYCKEFISRQKKLAIQMLKQTLKSTKNPRLRKTLKKITKKGRKDKQSLKVCIQGYCNPGCKDTIYQNGKTMSDATIKAITNTTETAISTGKSLPPSDKKFMVNTMKDTRRYIFKGKSSVLRNSFYEKLPRKQVAAAKKKGALSGCTLSIM